MEKDCKICAWKIILSDTNSYVVLTEKSVNVINNAKKRRSGSWTISTGERVHIAGEVGMSNLRHLSKT